MEFNAIARARHSADKRTLNRLLKDNIAQILVLEMNAPHPASRRQILVANTHINASPEFADVKLWQTQMLLHEVSFFSHLFVNSAKCCSPSSLYVAH